MIFNQVGWSIGNILLDFTGGSLSIIQVIITMLMTKNHDGGDHDHDRGGTKTSTPRCR